MEKEKWLRTVPGHDYFTPYDRFKHVWFQTGPTAYAESASIGHEFHPDGTTTVIDAAGESHRINLADIGQEARRIIIELELLLRRSLPEDCINQFTSFPDLSQFSDDLGNPASIFQQNSDLLQPAIIQITRSLLQTSGDNKRLYSWLGYNDGILSCFLAAVSLTCGIPPRAFQFASLQYARCPQTGSSRGLFLIDGNLAIANPAAKQSGRFRQHCLWFLPPALSSLLLFYLGVLRPVVIEILTYLRKEVVPQTVYIFCQTILKTGRSHFCTDEIPQMLRKLTKGLKVDISIRLIRQLYTAFFRQYFPDLCSPGPQEDSLVDRQGQHRFYTGQKHYGLIVTNIPRSLGIDLTEAKKMGAISQVLHTVFGLRSCDDRWQPLLQQSHFLPCSKYEAHALDTARVLAISEYSICSAGLGPAAALRARSLLKDCPYAQVVRSPSVHNMLHHFNCTFSP